MFMHRGIGPKKNKGQGCASIGKCCAKHVLKVMRCTSDRVVCPTMLNHHRMVLLWTSHQVLSQYQGKAWRKAQDKHSSATQQCNGSLSTGDSDTCSLFQLRNLAPSLIYSTDLAQSDFSFPHMEPSPQNNCPGWQRTDKSSGALLNTQKEEFYSDVMR